MFGASSRVGVAERAIQALPWGVWAGEESGPSWSGKNVSTDSALQLQTVYGCNRFICEGISTLPVDAFRRRGDGSSEAITPPPWLDQPTANLDFVAWCTQVLTSLLLDGDAFCRLTFDGSLAPQEIVPLDPASVQVYRDRGRKRYRVGGVDVDPFTVLHIPGIMRPGADRGMSPVEYARQTIGKGLAVEEFSARFFGQGMNLAGVIEDPGPVDSDKARMMARVWARLHSGTQKAHLPGVLQGGATWKATGVTNEQGQFLQTAQFSAAAICAFIFLIDPTEFGVSMDKGSSVTYANLEQRNARKVQVTFLPWIVRIERALSSLMDPPQYVKLNVGGLLRGDTKTRFETYEAASRINTAAQATGDKPMMLTAEMRALEDLDPIEDGEVGAVEDEARNLSAVEAIQKVYLGVGTVVTSDEARELVNELGADLPVPGPDFSAPAPT